MGDKKSGKSNLILKFLNIDVSSSESIKETVALDFKYGKKVMDGKTVRMQSYELGGGRVLASML